jgi:hypothetical protein
MAPRALPRPGRVPEQRHLSPKIHRRRWRSYGTLSRKLPIPLGFSIPRHYIGEGHRQGATRVLSHIGGVARAWAVPPWCEGRLWPLSDSLLVLVLRPGKIGVLELVSSNSENISCIPFLKHKNSRKQGTGTMASCQ